MISPRAYLASAVVIGGALFGCVQVGPKQFAVPSGIVAVSHPVAEKVPCACSKLPPIPEVVHIEIYPGKPVVADYGGERLLRAYVTAREKQ